MTGISSKQRGCAASAPLRLKSAGRFSLLLILLALSTLTSVAQALVGTTIDMHMVPQVSTPGQAVTAQLFLFKQNSAGAFVPAAGELVRVINLVGSSQVQYCSVITDANGLTSCLLPGSLFANRGSTQWLARFDGNATLAASTVELTHLVSAPSQLSISADAPDPSVASAASTLYNYTVTVNFTSGGTAISSGPHSIEVSDSATSVHRCTISWPTQRSCVLPSPQVGTLTLTADFAGDSGYASSRATTTHTVNSPTPATLSNATATVSYTERQASAVVVNGGLTLSHPNIPTVNSATVRITTGYQLNQDVLSCPSGCSALSPRFDATSGTLTLSGTQPLATYQTALRSIVFSNGSHNPGVTDRALQWIVNNGLPSAAAISTVHVVAVEEPPVLVAGGTSNYTEKQPASLIDGAITVSDLDSAGLDSARVVINDGYQPDQDVLACPGSCGGLTASFNASTGVLSLSGTQSLAIYQAALRSVTYRNTSLNPNTTLRSVEWTAVSAGAQSNPVYSSVTLTAVDDAPTLQVRQSPLAYSENQPATPIDTTIAVTDPDTTTLTSATVQISGGYQNGEDLLACPGSCSGLTASFNATSGKLTLSSSNPLPLATYQQALRAVTYVNSSDDPSTTQRTITWKVINGPATAPLSAEATSHIDVSSTNDPPTVSGSGTLAYAESPVVTTFPSVPIEPGLLVSDIDSAKLSSATVQITTGYRSGEDHLACPGCAGQNITVSSSADDKLELSSAQSLPWGTYQAALRTVTYTNTSRNPNTAARKVTWSVANSKPSAPFLTTITITAVDDKPTIQVRPTPLTYYEGEGAVLIDNTISTADADSANLTSATVRITGNYQSNQDELSCPSPCGGLTASFGSATGTLTLSGSQPLATYQAALRAVRYRNSSENPIANARTITWQVSNGPANAPVSSDAVTSQIDVRAVDNSPRIQVRPTPLSYTENQPAAVIDDTLTVSDPDNTTLTAATVQITGGYQSGEDVLACGSCNGLTVRFTDFDGLLTLSGTQPLATYQAALRSVSYRNTSDDPHAAAARTVTWTAITGAVSSTPVTSTINVTAVEDPPVLAVAPVLNYTEGQGAVVLDTGLTAADVDTATWLSATVKITTGYVNGQDVLSCAAPCGGLTATFDAPTGTLSLSSNQPQSPASYQAALRLVKYANTSETPNTAQRAVTWVVRATSTSGTSAISAIVVTAVDDPPTLTAGATLAYTEDAYPQTQGAAPIDGTVTVRDIDSANLISATARISAGYVNGQDVLDCPGACGGLTKNFTAANGTLTLLGNQPLATYQAALSSVTYANSSNSPNTATRTVTWIGNSSASASSAPVTSTITVTPTDDPPQISAGGTLNYTEHATAILDGSVSVSDPDSTTLSSATVQIVGGYTRYQDVLVSTCDTLECRTLQWEFNDSLGQLTLTGTASLSTYQAALRLVSYRNDSLRPNTQPRRVRWTITSGTQSGTAESTIRFAGAVNDAPRMSAGGTLEYYPGQTAQVIDRTIGLEDGDDEMLVLATVQIATPSGQVLSEDELACSGGCAGLTAQYDASSGLLILRSRPPATSAPLANFLSALQSVTYFNHATTPNFSSRTVTWQVSDGKATSEAVTSTVIVHSDGPLAAEVDTFIQGGDQSQSTHGGLPYLSVNESVAGQGGEQATSRSLLRFTLPQSAPARVERAVLKLNVTELHAAAPKPLVLQVAAVAADKWVSDEVTWESRLGVEDLSPQKILATVVIENVGPIEIDVTPFVNGELGSDRAVSFELFSPYVLRTDAHAGESEIRLASHEAGASGPQLQLFGSVPACADGDGDGVCDEADNCPNLANPLQQDANANHIGDACDVTVGRVYAAQENVALSAQRSPLINAAHVPVGSPDGQVLLKVNLGALSAQTMSVGILAVFAETLSSSPQALDLYAVSSEAWDPGQVSWGALTGLRGQRLASAPVRARGWVLFDSAALSDYLQGKLNQGQHTVSFLLAPASGASGLSIRGSTYGIHAPHLRVMPAAPDGVQVTERVLALSEHAGDFISVQRDQLSARFGYGEWLVNLPEGHVVSLRPSTLHRPDNRSGALRRITQVRFDDSSGPAPDQDTVIVQTDNVALGELAQGKLHLTLFPLAVSVHTPPPPPSENLALNEAMSPSANPVLHSLAGPPLPPVGPPCQEIMPWEDIDRPGKPKDGKPDGVLQISLWRPFGGIQDLLKVVGRPVQVVTNPGSLLPNIVPDTLTMNTALHPESCLTLENFRVNLDIDIFHQQAQVVTDFDTKLVLGAIASLQLGEQSQVQDSVIFPPAKYLLEPFTTDRIINRVCEVVFDAVEVALGALEVAAFTEVGCSIGAKLSGQTDFRLTALGNSSGHVEVGAQVDASVFPARWQAINRSTVTAGFDPLKTGYGGSMAAQLNPYVQIIPKVSLFDEIEPLEDFAYASMPVEAGLLLNNTLTFANTLAGDHLDPRLRGNLKGYFKGGLHFGFGSKDGLGFDWLKALRYDNDNLFYVDKEFAHWLIPQCGNGETPPKRGVCELGEVHPHRTAPSAAFSAAFSPAATGGGDGNSELECPLDCADHLEFASAAYKPLGDDKNVEFSIVNGGTAPSGPFTLLYIGLNASGGEEYRGEVSLPSLAAGEVYNGFFSLPTAVPGPSKAVKVRLEIIVPPATTPIDTREVSLIDLPPEVVPVAVICAGEHLLGSTLNCQAVIMNDSFTPVTSTADAPIAVRATAKIGGQETVIFESTVPPGTTLGDLDNYRFPHFDWTPQQAGLHELWLEVTHLQSREKEMVNSINIIDPLAARPNLVMQRVEFDTTPEADGVVYFGRAIVLNNGDGPAPSPIEVSWVESNGNEHVKTWNDLTVAPGGTLITPIMWIPEQIPGLPTTLTVCVKLLAESVLEWSSERKCTTVELHRPDYTPQLISAIDGTFTVAACNIGIGNSDLPLKGRWEARQGASRRILSETTQEPPTVGQFNCVGWLDESHIFSVPEGWELWFSVIPQELDSNPENDDLCIFNCPRGQGPGSGGGGGGHVFPHPGGSHGDPHLWTFDGINYDFHAHDELILVTDQPAAGLQANEFIVEVRQYPLGRVAVNSAVATRLYSPADSTPTKVAIYANRSDKLWINDVPYTGSFPLQLPGGSVLLSEGTYTVQWSDGAKELKVAVWGNESLDVQVGLADAMQGHVLGLLGNFNLQAGDDFRDRNGQVLGTPPLTYDILYGEDAQSPSFRNAWRVAANERLFNDQSGEGPPSEPSFPGRSVPGSEDLTATQMSEAGAACRAAGVIEPSAAFDACVFDYVQTGNPAFIQSAAGLPQGSAKGHGLLAEIFNTDCLYDGDWDGHPDRPCDPPVATRIDANIDVWPEHGTGWPIDTNGGGPNEYDYPLSNQDRTFGQHSPVSGPRDGDCSVRWTGEIEVPRTDNYMFSGAGTVWVGGEYLGNGFGYIFKHLEAGQRYDLRVEFVCNWITHVLDSPRLFWTTEDFSINEVVPSSALFPPSGSVLARAQAVSRPASTASAVNPPKSPGEQSIVKDAAAALNGAAGTKPGKDAVAPVQEKPSTATAPPPIASIELPARRPDALLQRIALSVSPSELNSSTLSGIAYIRNAGDAPLPPFKVVWHDNARNSGVELYTGAAIPPGGQWQAPLEWTPQSTSGTSPFLTVCVSPDELVLEWDQRNNCSTVKLGEPNYLSQIHSVASDVITVEVCNFGLGDSTGAIKGRWTIGSQNGQGGQLLRELTATAPNKGECLVWVDTVHESEVSEGKRLEFTVVAAEADSNPEDDTLCVLNCGRLASAGSAGDPHLMTFDRVQYDLHAQDEFILVTDDPTPGLQDQEFLIEVRQRPWNTGTVNSAVATRVGETVIGFYANRSNKVWVDHAAYGGGFPLQLAEGQVLRSADGSTYTVLWRDSSRLTVTVSAEGFLDVQVDVPDTRREKISGLLGNYNLRAEDDFRDREGKVLGSPPLTDELLYGRDEKALSFRKAWRVGADERLFDEMQPDDGQIRVEGFPSLPAPRLEDFSVSQLNPARSACSKAGLIEPSETFDACVLDYLVSGGGDFIPSAQAMQRNLGVSHGLRAEIFNSHCLAVDAGRDCPEPIGVRVDANINVDPNQGTGWPLALDGQDYPVSNSDHVFSNGEFSIRWSGEIEVPQSGAYRFHTLGGAKMWLDDAPVVSDSLPLQLIQLQKGRRYRIRLELISNDRGLDTPQLIWEQKDYAINGIVPSSALFPPAVDQ